MPYMPIFRNNPRNRQLYYPLAVDMWNPCCEFNNNTMFPPPPHFPFHNTMTHAPLPLPPHFPFPNMMTHEPHFPFHNNMMSHAPPFGGGSEWRETADAHLVTVELPGFKKEEVKVKVEDGGRVLEIRGEKEKEREEKHENWRHYERSNGRFFRTFSLPENCKADHIKLSMEHGVLTVTIPKRDVHKLSELSHGNKFDFHKMSESHHGNNVDHVHKMSESHHGNNVDHVHKMSESHGKKDDVHKMSESHARKFDFRKISESHGNKVEIED